jgi:hypothetical protein
MTLVTGNAGVGGTMLLDKEPGMLLPGPARSPMQVVDKTAPGGPKQLIFGGRPALKVC